MSKVIVELEWDEARALSFASSVGLKREEVWSNPEYRKMGEAARLKLLAATAKAEREVSHG